MAKIFICYRREDSAYPAHQVYRDLSDHFGPASVVFDVDTIPLGTDFREYLNNQVSECDILLAIIGDQWVEILKQRREDPKDFVQIEIQAALERDIPVVPILVGKALVPNEKDLPPELVGLSYRNAAEVRAGPDLADQIKRLIKGLDNLIVDRKTDEVKSKETETSIKPNRPEPAKGIPPEPKTEATVTTESKSLDPRKMSNALKFGSMAGVIVLLIVGIGLYFSAKTAKEQAAQGHKEVETRPGRVFRDKLKDGSEGPEMIILAAGNFLMGSPDTKRNRDSNEGPQRRVTISRSFALSTNEITFAEYDTFAKVSGRQLPDDEGWGRGDRPVINVSWEDATAYARWLSEQTGQDYRLPTEAEWEYAARAGSTTAYSFGDDPFRLDEYAWFGSNSGKKTHPVGQKQPNNWGLYDMHGNVWEWCHDWYGEYQSSRVSDPEGPATGAYRVMRGGSRGSDARLCRSAYRGYGRPGYRNLFIGFRLSRSVALGF